MRFESGIFFNAISERGKKMHVVGKSAKLRDRPIKHNLMDVCDKLSMKYNAHVIKNL